MKITRTAPDVFNIWFRRTKGCELTYAELTSILTSIELSTKYNLQGTGVFFELIIRYVVLCTLFFVNILRQIKKLSDFVWTFHWKCVYLHCFQREVQSDINTAPTRRKHYTATTQTFQHSYNTSASILLLLRSDWIPMSQQIHTNFHKSIFYSLPWKFLFV